MATPPIASAIAGSLRASIHRDLPYTDGLRMQKDALNAMRADPDAPQRLLLVEHRPTITLGRTFKPGDLLRPEPELRADGIEVVRTNRGGEATWHGPGQWTVYPLLRLDRFCKSLHRYMRLLEEMVIVYLAGHGVAGARREGYTGVWVGRDKLAAIGIAVSGWISWHGVAVNLHPDRGAWTSAMVPCGIPPEVGGVTDLQACTGERHDMDTEARRLAAAFRNVFAVPEACFEWEGNAP